MSKKAAVLLDRDGVINRSIQKNGRPFPPQTPQNVEIIPGVIEACEKFRQHGLLRIVVTNQPDISRGTITGHQVDAINQILNAQIDFEAVYVCPHDDMDGCLCRKPQPGMLVQAAKDWNIDLSRSIMVGDRWRDIEAGKKAGCKTVFIDYQYQETRPDQPDLIVKNLWEAVPWIIQNTGQK